MLMKYLLAGGLMTITATVTQGTTAHAQASMPNSATPARTQSAPLVTQPASLQAVPINAGQPATPYTADKLNDIFGTLQANPKASTPTSTNSIESLIQRFSVSTPKQTTIDPLDFFKPPALDGGVKIPIQ